MIACYSSGLNIPAGGFDGYPLFNFEKRGYTIWQT